MADYEHHHPGQKEPRAHGETHHENRIVDLNTASEEELADLPIVGPEARPGSDAAPTVQVMGRGAERAGVRQRHDRRSEERRRANRQLASVSDALRATPTAA